ncbi:MAG: hypothetical protein ABSD56_06860, partial [Bryobacteraceae bacterium]
TFLFTERLKVKITAQAFNFFNHANMYVEGYGVDVSSQTVIQSCKGCTGGVADRRTIQLMAKFIF